MKLSGARHAFVTGGASGIGLGIAGALADRGLHVTIADIDRESLDAVVAQRRDRFQGAALDVRDRGGWAHTKESAETAFGPVDVLINNAGIWADGCDLADLDPDVFDRLMAVDVTGVFNGVSTFARSMRERRAGHIVNTASIMGLTSGIPGTAVYTAAKAAVVTLSEVLRQELTPHGVGVSVLCPGFVASNLIATSRRAGSQVVDAEKSSSAGLPAMEPSRAGEIVADGIEENLPYIFTHPEYWPSVESRSKELEKAFRIATAGR